MARSLTLIAAAILFAGLIGCGGGSQSGVDPSGNAQALQGQAHSWAAKASVSFAWTHTKVQVPAGQIIFAASECGKPGSTVISGGYRKHDIGDDIDIIDSFPVTNASWQITAKNNGDKQEAFVVYLLCSTGS